jgi:cytochrome c556
MTRALVAATAAIALLAGCQQAADNAPANQAESAAANAAATPTEAAGAAPLGAAVSADQAKTIMHDRHEGMEDIGDAMKVAGRWAKSESGDVTAVRGAAATIARLAPQASGWFPPGTGPDVAKTRAKPEIWQKPEDFAAKLRNFQQAAQAFNAAAQGSDRAAVVSAQGDLGKTCKACHDLYRAEKH